MRLAILEFHGNDEPETVNDSVPAREPTGKVPGTDRDGAGKSMVPAPAVPVAVPVAAAAGEAPLLLHHPTAGQTLPASPGLPAPVDGAPRANGTAAPRPPRLAPVDDMPRRRLEVVDEGRPGPDPFPLCTRFRHDLAASLARTAPHPAGGGLDVFEAGERALSVLGVEKAVEVCRQRVLDAVARRERQPSTFKFFVECVLGDELTRRTAQPKGPRKCVGQDSHGQPIWAEAT